MLHMFFILFYLFPASCVLSYHFVQGGVLVLIMLKSCLVFPHFINTLTQPRACSELLEPNMMMMTVTLELV